ncbi:unnamed protein product [Sphagnum balticum]
MLLCVCDNCEVNEPLTYAYQMTGYYPNPIISANVNVTTLPPIVYTFTNSDFKAFDVTVTNLNDTSQSQIISASTVTDLPGLLLAAGTYRLDVRVNDIHYAYTDVPSIQPIQVIAIPIDAVNVTTLIADTVTSTGNDPAATMAVVSACSFLTSGGQDTFDPLPTDTPLDDELFLTPAASPPLTLSAAQKVQLAAALGMTVEQLFGVDDLEPTGTLNASATTVSVCVPLSHHAWIHSDRCHPSTRQPSPPSPTRPQLPVACAVSSRRPLSSVDYRSGQGNQIIERVDWRGRSEQNSVVVFPAETGNADPLWFNPPPYATGAPLAKMEHQSTGHDERTT